MYPAGNKWLIIILSGDVNFSAFISRIASHLNYLFFVRFVLNFRLTVQLLPVGGVNMVGIKYATLRL